MVVVREEAELLLGGGVVMSTQYLRDKSTGEFRGSVAGATAPTPTPTSGPAGKPDLLPGMGYRAAVSRDTSTLARAAGAETGSATRSSDMFPVVPPVATPNATAGTAPAAPPTPPVLKLSLGARLFRAIQRVGPNPAKQSRRW